MAGFQAIDTGRDGSLVMTEGQLAFGGLVCWSRPQWTDTAVSGGAVTGPVVPCTK